MSVKKNIVANVIGSGWYALMGIIFIPIYIKYMGIESYGLVGVFALLLAWLALLDMGMTPTISREMARFSGSTHTNQSILNLLRSVEILALCISLIIIISIIVSADWLVINWLNVEMLPQDVVVNAIIIMGFIAALKFLEGIYRSAIVGLQKQVQLNVMQMFFSTLRGFGAVGVLIFYSPTIYAFFVWQAVVSVLNIVVFRSYLYFVLPKSKTKTRFSWLELNKIKKYAAGMMGTTFLAILLTQIDKILLTKILSLSEYGYYTMAVLVVSALSIAVGPVSQAYFPKFTELKAKGQNDLLVDAYHKSSQLITVVVGVMAGYLIFFSEPILIVWTQDKELVNTVAPLVSVLALGSFLNILMWMPYQMQLAHGWTSLALKINIVAVIVIVPSILIVVPLYGSIGAAWVWVALNMGYVSIGVHFMYKKILTKEKWRWYFEDILIPLAVCFGLIFFFKNVLSSPNMYVMVLMIALSSIVVFFITALSAPLVRVQVLNIISRISNEKNKR